MAKRGHMQETRRRPKPKPSGRRSVSHGEAGRPSPVVMARRIAASGLLMPRRSWRAEPLVPRGLGKSSGKTQSQGLLCGFECANANIVAEGPGCAQ